MSLKHLIFNNIIILFLVIPANSHPALSTIHSCLLGNPNAPDWKGRPAGIAGEYFTNGRIVFNDRPVREWEFMATGTGLTGLTVRFPRSMLVQINHSGSLDERGLLRSLGQFYFDLEGSPFLNASNFGMEHDLRNSVIRVQADTRTGCVRVEIRAHMELDVIRLDIYDERNSPGALTCSVVTDYPHFERALSTGGTLTYHENSSSIFNQINSECGFKIGSEIRDQLMGRIFGAGIVGLSDTKKLTGSAGYLTAPSARHHKIFIAGVSTLNGVAAFETEVSERLNTAIAMSDDEFIKSHESWWSKFWSDSYFEPDDNDGQLVRYKAAFDLYRYYLACSANERREIPLRFQNDLFRFNLIQHPWSTMVINSIETYQAFYGAMRTGNLKALRGLFNFYKNYVPVFQRHSQARFSHEGFVIPYEHNTWGSYLFWNGEVLEGYTEEKSPYLKDSWAGNLWVLLLMCDYSDLSGDEAFVRDTLFPLAGGILNFFQHHYPVRENGKIVFSAAKAGETWQGVKNPLELLCAFKILLPRLLKLGETMHGEDSDLRAWRDMLNAIPDIPLGQLKYDAENPFVKPEILPGSLLVPAQDMSTCESFSLSGLNGKKYFSINRQQTELYAIWPSKLFLQEPQKLEIARESYFARIWQHINVGWALDVAHAACLGLNNEVSRWFDRHFEYTFTFPCGLAREESVNHPECFSIPIYPSMQGMGTGVIPVFEMLLQDYPDRLILLPCWQENIPVRFSLYSPFAGKVTVDYQPERSLIIKTERKITVQIADALKDKVKLVIE